jgi:magnesium transporter
MRVLLYRPAQRKLESGSDELLDAWLEDQSTIIWMDFGGEQPELERQILLERFGIHPLAIQDALRDRHPPKIEAFDTFTFILFKGLDSEATGIHFKTIQLALFVGERFLVTRHSSESPSTDQLWSEVQRDAAGFARGPDTLALRLSRIMVDRYLRLLLALEPRLDVLETEMVEKPRDEMLAELIGYKTNLKQFRRVFLYHVQLLQELKSGRFPAIRPDLAHTVNDVYEQQERASSLADLYYEMASDLIDGYISVASHRLNNIMKVLTIITAIFVPLSFLAGIYGMNFEYMPELKSQSGYFVLLGIMGSMVTVLLYVFRRKRWL